MKDAKQSFFSLFLTVIIINIILMTAAIIFYKGDFQGMSYPFSYAGDYYTTSGLRNAVSMYIYSSDMAISGLMLLVFSYKFYRQNGTSAIVKPLLCVTAGAGFLLASLSPDDIRHSTHVLGSAIAIASLWIIATNYIYEIRPKIQPINYFLLQVLLQIPILTYATTYFLGIDPASYIIQKFALASLCVVLLLSSYIQDKYKNV